MATTEPQLRQWTRDEYYCIAQAGLFVGQRVELIDGEILAMTPMNATHAACLQLVAEVLRGTFGGEYCVRTQLPLSLGTDTEPEPDVAVVPGTPRDYTSHPTTALLVVEISDTTLDFDRTRKRTLYARAGIAEYWIINLPARAVEVHRQPRGGDYTACFSQDPTVSLAPLAAPRGAIQVAELLP